MNSKEQLQKIVQENLSRVTENTYPYFYNMVNGSPDGYRKAEDLVINYALKNRMSIPATIAHLESSMG
jgi:hypothetical protein